MACPSPISPERVDAHFGRAPDWLAPRGPRPFPFQLEVWQAIAEGRSGLLHATTGAGKTLAVWLGALMRFVPPALAHQAQAAIESEATANPAKAARRLRDGAMPAHQVQDFHALVRRAVPECGGGNE